MAGLMNIPEVLHKIHVWLYPNYLPNIKGAPKETGVFFVAPGTPDVRIGVTENLGENGIAKIIGIVPQLPSDKK
jgi:hypothetical protein